MPRTKVQYEEMRMATHKKIRTAALNLLMKKGFAMTGVQDIADEVQINIGSLYRHYKTKEELFNEMIEEAIESLDELSRMMQSKLPSKKIIEPSTVEICADMSKGNDFSNMLSMMTQAIYAEIASLFFSTIQGLSIMQTTLKEKFTMPSPQQMTGSLFREESTD